MTVGAYDIATEHAILVEASAAGKWSAVPEALLFGVLLGAVYDLFRIASAIWGLRENAAPADSRIGRMIGRLHACRCRPIRVGCTDVGRDSGRAVRRIPAYVVQFLLDILFFLLCGVLGAVFLYWRNDGILRWYLVLCGILGFWAYHCTAGVLVMRGIALLLAAVRALLCITYNLTLYYPLRLGYCIGAALLASARKTAMRIGAAVHQRTAHRTAHTRKQRKRIGALWQKKRNSQRKKQVSSRRSHFLSSSDSVPSPSSSFTDRSATTKKKLL